MKNFISLMPLATEYEQPYFHILKLWLNLLEYMKNDYMANGEKIHVDETNWIRLACKYGKCVISTTIKNINRLTRNDYQNLWPNSTHWANRKISPNKYTNCWFGLKLYFLFTLNLLHAPWISIMKIHIAGNTNGIFSFMLGPWYFDKIY